MDTGFLGKNILYDGSQLRHAFAYETVGFLGDSLVTFEGPAFVKDHLVDIEDRKANDFIASENMLHFIVEIYNTTITETVLWQLKLVEITANVLSSNGVAIVVDGDDIMVNDHKLSVSIATLSRFSGLIHLGLNIVVGSDCPVKAIGLSELNIDLPKFENEVTYKFMLAFKAIKRASYKVKEV